MRNPNLILSLACATLLFAACKKEVVSPDYPSSPDQQNIRATGALPDDPAMVAKVPVIMSAGFLKNRQNLEMVMAANRPRKDASAPSVTITSPSNCSTVSGTVSIQVSASDNVGVSSVSLTVNGSLIGTQTVAPYNFTWNAISGNHTVTATAKDAAGNTAQHSISVSNNTVTADVAAPTVSITSPSNGSAVSGTVTVAVAASDNIAVSSVSLSANGVVVGTLSSSPYNFSWNTSSLVDGNHTLTAKASDGAGNSSTFSIVVSKNTTTLPSTSLPSSFSLVTPPIGYQGGEASCVSFSTVYAARSVEQFYKSNASTYSFSTNIFSPEFSYNQTKVGDCGSGSAITTSLDLMKNKGSLPWSSMPYSDQNGCSLMPTNSQLIEGSSFKIGSYAWMYATDRTGIKTMLTNKHAVIISVDPDQSFFDAKAGFIWKAYSGGKSASHSLVICGYDDAKHAYKVMNSWGTAWGDAGYSWIDYDFFPYTGPGVCYVITG